MTASQENIPLLDWIQDTVPANAESGEHVFTADHKFQIHVSKAPVEVEKERFSDCEKLSIRISQYHKEDPNEPKESTIEVENYKFNLTWFIMPSSVHPQRDERFATQEWKDFFIEEDDYIGTKSVAWVSPDLVCDIVRYCHTLTKLKAFW